MSNYTSLLIQSLAPVARILPRYKSLDHLRMALLLCVLSFTAISTANAQAITFDGGVEITYPLAGAAIGNEDTIYFNPGSIDIFEWRVTIGQSPDTRGLFDSGVKNFATTPWELVLSGLPNDGGPVTLRFWQRSKNSNWMATDIRYTSRVGGSAPAGTQRNNSQSGVNQSALNQPAAKQADNPATIDSNEPVVTLAVVPALIKNTGSLVRDLKAEHRNGQTFLTWVEVAGDAGYHVYRHTSPITESNISRAEKLTARWGPLDSDTSVNKHAHGVVPATYVVSDLGQPLSESNGLFVHTPSDTANAFYAVTTVVSGRENIAVSSGNSTSAAVKESASRPAPVLTVSLNKGKGLVYTQYMDYANWNPTFNGYAYNYTVALPKRYRKGRSYPLLVHPHAYGEQFRILDESEYGWQVIQLFPSDPGIASGSIHSWWFGYAADHNYKTDGPVPTSGSIKNFTEQRLMQAIEDTISDPAINVDPLLVHAYGHSMGASGSLSLGIRYGNIIAGIYGSEAMTNYRTSPIFQEEFGQLWGSKSNNLPIQVGGPYSEIIKRYEGTGVWDWMDHHKQLIDRRGDKMAYLMIAQGKADDVIDWRTQGEPLARVFNKASVGFSTKFIANAGHSWLGFAAIVEPLFGFGNDLNFPWRYPVNMSFPSIQNASGAGALTPGLSETDEFNLNIEWATPHTRFAKPIVDEPRRYEVSLRTEVDRQTADITPRNTQRFRVTPGEVCEWTTSNNSKRRTIAKGTVTADSDALITVPGVPITYNGTRVSIQCS